MIWLSPCFFLIDFLSNSSGFPQCAHCLVKIWCCQWMCWISHAHGDLAFLCFFLIDFLMFDFCTVCTCLYVVLIWVGNFWDANCILNRAVLWKVKWNLSEVKWNYDIICIYDKAGKFDFGETYPETHPRNTPRNIPAKHPWDKLRGSGNVKKDSPIFYICM